MRSSSNNRSVAAIALGLTLLLAPLLACRQALPEFEPGIPTATPCDWTANGELAHNRFGFAVGSAGDVNGDGDGLDDILVGARNYDGYRGQVTLYGGDARQMDAAPHLTLYGPEANSWYGHAVGSAGDVDGDGLAEVIIGAYGHDEWAGRAYVPCLR